MTPQDQTIVSDKEKGIYGNCWITSYACYLDLDVNKCPQIQHLFECEEPGYGFVDDVVDLWLSKYGYERRYFNADEDPHLKGFDDYYFAWGPSPRGVNHQVIFKNGELFFDPHPTKAGLVEIKGYETLVRVNKIGIPNDERSVATDAQ